MKQRKLMAILAVVLVLVLVAGVLAACNPKEEPVPTPPAEDTTGIYDPEVYTYRMGPSDLPTAWNVHTYQSNSATYVLDYSSDALYTFDYNEDYSGYVIVPSMAAGDFVDVTADYVGKYGIKAGEENKAYAIPLKSDLKFDNGDPITAETFVESMKLLLAPEAANFRADNVYQSGDLKIYGAESYVKGGSYAYGSFVSENYGAEEYVAIEDTTVSDEGYIHWGEYDFAINVYSGGNWGSNSLFDYADAGYLGGGYALTEDGFKQYIDAEGTTKVLRADVTEGDKTTTTYYLTDGTTVVYRGTAYDFYYDEECTQLIPGCEALSAKWQYGLVEKLLEAADEEGNVKLTPELLAVVQECIAQLHGVTYEQYKAACAKAGNYVGVNGDINYADVEWQEMGLLGKYWDEVAYEGNVGFFVDDQDRLVVVLVNAMEENFYLKYELCTSFFLVHPETYRSCITYNQGVYTNTYGTSVDTYVGFGPYKLTQYLADSTLVLERNMNWHGYAEGTYKAGTYQTDNVVYTVVKNDDTRLEMFLKGQLDSYGLQAKDMADYISSSYVYYNDSESTWYLAMNPDYDTLEGLQETAKPVLSTENTVNKTVLTIDSFRQALSWSLNREEFNLTLSPTSGIAKGLLSSMIVADPEAGIMYRDTDAAKDAILEFWGLADSWGEGKEYPSRDAAIASITGYDLAGAKALFTAAYNEAVELGYITADQIASGKWEVQIMVGIPAEAAYYNNGYEFLQTNWTNAVQGTPFEGHLSFKKSQVLGSTSFGTYLRNGSVDMLFGVGYGGSMFNPFSMMDCFTGSLQYDPLTDKTSIMLDITIDLGDGEKTYRASLYDWVSKCLLGTDITANIIGADGEATGATKTFNAGSSVDGSIRTAILAKCETKIMTLSNIFPVQTDSSASLRCMRVNYKTENYVLGMGRGGIQYYTYSMSDDEFTTYAASQEGGVLNYKD